MHFLKLKAVTNAAIMLQFIIVNEELTQLFNIY